MMGFASKAVMGERLDRIDALKRVLLLGQDKENWPRGGAGEERMVVDGEGRRRVVSSRIAALKDAHGAPAGSIEILNDHTETDRLRREVNRLDTLAAMGEMAANVAHQIRNPLNGVEGFASLLQRTLERDEDRVRPDAARYARNVVHGVREVNSIINGMLMLARGDRLQIRPCNLDLLMAEVVEDLRTTLSRMGLDAKILFRPGMGDGQVSCDWMKLKQACLNLGHNALEAVAGRERRTIRISTRFRGDQAVIRVTDTGKGMDKDTAAKVFRPFFTTRDRGTGLGLSLASKLVDLHGGRLCVRSLPGIGTTFKIELKGRLSGGRNGDQA
jgi:signal transduction histidine kinase